MTALYAALFSVQASAEAAFSPPPIATDEATARLARRVPILAPEAFQVNPEQLKQLWDEICALTLQCRSDLAEPLERICRWPDEQEENLPRLATLFLRDETQLISQENGLDPSLLAFVINQTLHPFLRRYALVVTPLVEKTSWYQPYCPICGGQPDLAALTKPHGARRLLCSRCDFEWPFRRTSCPFCGNEDPEQYLYVPSEDGVYRLYLCDRCGHYLKTIDLREVIEERLLPVERVLTLPMDLAARQEGYR